MKKILALLLTTLVCLGISAHRLNTTAEGVPVRTASAPAVRVTPATASAVRTTADGVPSMLIGSYVTDEIIDEGYGLWDMVEEPSQVLMGTLVPSANFYKLLGNSITSMRLAVTQAVRITRLQIYRVDINDGTSVIQLVNEQPLTDYTAQAGWNTIKLDTPYALPADAYGILLAYEFEQANRVEPVSVIANYANECSWLIYGNFNGREGWHDYSNYGALSVQAYVECATLPAVDVVLSNLHLESHALEAKGNVAFSFSVYNFGTDPVTTFTVDAYIGDILLKTFTEQDFTITSQRTEMYFQLSLPAELSRGEHNFSLKLSSVNGGAPTSGFEDDRLDAGFVHYMPQDVVPRQKHLVEEVTSHTCPKCPSGTALLDVLTTMRNDIAVACIHGNLSSQDPFNTPQCDSLMNYLMITGFPEAAFNRVPFDGEGIMAVILHENLQQGAQMYSDVLDHASLPAFASVDLDKTVTDGVLTLTVSGKGGEYASELLKDYRLTVYVLEDSLRYRQQNNGKWTSNYIHNHVMRRCVTPIVGDEIHWTSSSAYSNTYVVPLDAAWNTQQLSVVAFLNKAQPYADYLNGIYTDPNNMYVSNANAMHLTEQGSQGGGGSGDDTDSTKVEARLLISPLTLSCQLMGEASSPNMNYVVGSNFSTYAPALWNTQSGEVTDFAAYEEGAFHAVNDSGMAVGDDGDFALAFRADGTKLDLYKDASDAGSSACGVSNDGKVIAGFYFKTDFSTFPCIWNEQGERTDLPLPTSLAAGYHVGGGEARMMSADGNTIVGFIFDDMSLWPAIVWHRNAQGGYDYDLVSADYFEMDYGQGKPYMQFTPKGLSANGEWLSLQVQAEYQFLVSAPPTIKAARFNLVTRQLEVLTMPSPITAQNMEPVTPGNDGTLPLFTMIDGMVGRIGYLWPVGTDTPVCLDDVLVRVKDMPEICCNVPCTVSADGSMIQGFGITTDNDIFSYVFDYNDYLQALDIALPAIDAPCATGRTYNLMGMPVVRPTAPGLYVVDGRKVIIR